MIWFPCARREEAVSFTSLRDVLGMVGAKLGDFGGIGRTSSEPCSNFRCMARIEVALEFTSCIEKAYRLSLVYRKESSLILDAVCKGVSKTNVSDTFWLVPASWPLCALVGHCRPNRAGP